MKSNCFAISPGGNCLALNETICKTCKCPFYKSKMQIEFEYNRGNLRVKKLCLPIHIVDTIKLLNEKR